ncbi:hypothetical protein MADA3029_960003 [Vibrio nigripulchritudo MADA3029]|nr:hypothetical protein VIBNIMADA3020_950003 [Vibrio nigripulchritudo MADA3020]CCN51862.1 hypothetical protein VIBNIMADA3021_1180003 [Vibrio nigripulchritudo MADA3021]CCN62364.1 hypothetical protein MADA3029_960003 [Vibrio nigripulchritudo MADA3029]
MGSRYQLSGGDTYLLLVTDTYSRKIVVYQDALIYHSDRGSHYCSGEYQTLHQQYEYSVQ